MSSGIASDKFIDINKVVHTFPQEIKQIGFAVTLLHNHPHAPKNFKLFYENHFTKSKYVKAEEAQGFYPCSWYLENGEVIAYEFSDQKLQFSKQEVEQHLKVLDQRGFKNYGTTIRPIQNFLELETKDGHIYIPISQWKNSDKVHTSETTSNGKALTSCSAYSYCYVTQMCAHVTDYGHDVW